MSNPNLAGGDGDADGDTGRIVSVSSNSDGGCRLPDSEEDVGLDQPPQSGVFVHGTSDDGGVDINKNDSVGTHDDGVDNAIAANNDNDVKEKGTINEAKCQQLVVDEDVQSATTTTNIDTTASTKEEKAPDNDDSHLKDSEEEEKKSDREEEEEKEEIDFGDERNNNIDHDSEKNEKNKEEEENNNDNMVKATDTSTIVTAIKRRAMTTTTTSTLPRPTEAFPSDMNNSTNDGSCSRRNSVRKAMMDRIQKSMVAVANASLHNNNRNNGASRNNEHLRPGAYYSVGLNNNNSNNNEAVSNFNSDDVYDHRDDDDNDFHNDSTSRASSGVVRGGVRFFDHHHDDPEQGRSADAVVAVVSQQMNYVEAVVVHDDLFHAVPITTNTNTVRSSSTATITPESGSGGNKKEGNDNQNGNSQNARKRGSEKSNSNSSSGNDNKRKMMMILFILLLIFLIAIAVVITMLVKVLRTKEEEDEDVLGYKIQDDDVLAYVPETICYDRIPGQNHVDGQSGTLCTGDDTYPHGGGVCNVLAKSMMEYDGTATSTSSSSSSILQSLQETGFYENDDPAGNNRLLSIINGGFCRDDIGYGDFTGKDLHDFLVFHNSIVVIKLTGLELMNVLQDAANSAMLFYSTGTGSAAYPYGYNIRWKIDGTTSTMYDIQILKHDTWIDVDMDSTYYVITSDYLANGGDMYYSFMNISGPDRRYDVDIKIKDAFVTWTIQRLTIDDIPIELYSTQDYIRPTTTPQQRQ